MTTRRQESATVPLSLGGTLQVYLSYTEEPCEDAVVYVHGFGSTRTGEKPLALEDACARRGWTFASFDFRGHGGSSGSLLDLRGSGLLEDLEAMHASLAAWGVRRLFPVGSSMGGWAAAWFTLRFPDIIPACVLIAPALDFLRNRWLSLTEQEQQLWKQTGRLRVRNQWLDAEIGFGLVEEIDRFPLADLAARWARPLLIFHGMADEIIPYTDTLGFVERISYADVELRLFKNGDHRLLALKEEMAETACAFFARYSGVQASP